MSDSIRVVCRLRPINKIQIANNGQECVTYTSKDITICVDGEYNKYNFTFDKIFGPKSHQVDIYHEVAVPVVKSVIGGFNGTIFAYGQTGGGKTWTMEGPNHHDHQFKGLIPRTIQGLFQAISEGDQNVEYVIKCSYIQIYNQKLFDLLDPSKARLQIKQDKHRGVFIQNCTEISVGSSEHMLKTMDSGAQNRKVAFTGMNQRSSRSHSLFIIYVNQKHIKKDSTRQSKLYFVDLAGSQKVSKTGCQGVQLQEAKNINQSLSALGNVINALTSDKGQHIPYRNSKLTRILQQSLGGNSKTTLIINCSMCTYNDKQTLGTLRFGYRAKSIKNKAKVNQQKSAKQLLVLLDAANKTIMQLKLQIGGKMPIKVEEAENTENREATNALIEELKQKLEQSQQEEMERQKQLKDMQLRVKNVLLQLSQTRQQYGKHLLSCNSIIKNLKGCLSKLNKYMHRVYVDLEYWINNLIIDGTEQNQQIKTNLGRTFQGISEFTAYYDKDIKTFFKQIEEDEERNDNLQEQEVSISTTRKKIRLIYADANNNDSNSSVNDDLQMSVIAHKVNHQIQEDNTVPNSDKASIQQSFTQILPLLQSFDTKQSHKAIIEEMSANLKLLKKDNQELQKENQKLAAENKNIAAKFQEKYEEKILDLEERVQEYRKIIKMKQLQITQYIKSIQVQKNQKANEMVISQRLKKIIQNNGNMKTHYEMEQKLRALASERQKLFNEYYTVRNELDEAEIIIKQKQEHIESLKEVMNELSTHQEVPQPINQKELQKKYFNQVYGTENPNIVVTVKGGEKRDNLGIFTTKKQSALRKKVTNRNDTKQEQKSNILPFIKGFFT